MKFLHTMIRVKNIEESMKFYTEVLDMKFDHKKRLEDCWLYFLTDADNTCQIELTVNDETPENGYNIGTGFGHFAFSVDSLDAFTAKIADAQRNTTGTANIIKLNNIIIPPKNYQSIFNLTGS